MAKQILLIEDTASMAALYLTFLQKENYQTDVAETGQAGLRALNTNAYDCVLLDLHLPDMQGLEILAHIQKFYTNLPVIVITAYGSITIAVDAMRGGAFDFIMKPFPASRLTTTVANAIKNAAMKRELTELRRETKQENHPFFIGSSPAMQAVMRQVDAVATSRASVFITGESGTGKELVAQAIHRLSPRAAKPFIAINCAAISRDLLESAMFGHVRGAFTGAERERAGVAKSADGGILFLDEICEMPLDLQAKMLRFIQSGQFMAVGSAKQEQVDVRFIAATNRDVLAEVTAGRFREDLYYRLHVIPLELPPLRERDDDVIELAHEFLRRFSAQEGKDFAGFTPDALASLRAFTWPGNVRQLEHMIHHVVVMNRGDDVTLPMLPALLQQTALAQDNLKKMFTPYIVKPLNELEKEAVMGALKASENDIPRAAAMLQVSPSTIYRKLHNWRIDMQRVAS